MSDRALELACASLTLLESLILELRDKDIFSSEEITGVFEDARDAHRNAGDTYSPEFHTNVGLTIEQIIQGRGAANICSTLDRLEEERKKTSG